MTALVTASDDSVLTGDLALLVSSALALVVRAGGPALVVRAGGPVVAGALQDFCTPTRIIESA